MPLNLSRTGLSSPAYRDWAEYTALEDGRAVGHIDEDRRVMLAVGICRTSTVQDFRPFIQLSTPVLDCPDIASLRALTAFMSTVSSPPNRTPKSVARRAIFAA
jgi:hypothetical protein